MAAHAQVHTASAPIARRATGGVCRLLPRFGIDGNDLFIIGPSWLADAIFRDARSSVHRAWEPDA